MQHRYLSGQLDYESIRDGIEIITQHAVALNPNDPVLQDIIKGDISTAILTLDREKTNGLHACLPDTCKLSNSLNFSSVIKMKFSILMTYKNNKIDSLYGIVLEISTDDHEKHLFKIPHKHVKAIVKLCNALGADIDEAYNQPKKPGLEKPVWDNLSIYKKKTHAHYEIIRKYIAQFALEITTDAKAIYLVDIGTGLGDALDVTANLLTASGKQVTALGIDTSEVNINKARERYADKNYRFEVGDSKALPTFIEKHEEHDYVLVISSGSMTRLVLNNTVEALYILQQICQHADALVAGGETTLLITSRMAKKSGFRIRHDLLETHKPPKEINKCLVLTKLDTIFPLHIKDNHLDLSWHADPVKVLDQNDSSPLLATIESLDISLANMHSDHLKISQLLAYLPNLKKVYLSGQENWAAQFKSDALDRSIYLEINPQRHIEIDDNNHELKRYTQGFYRKVQGLLFTSLSRNIDTLNKEVVNNLLYSPPIYGYCTLNEILFYIKRMEELVDTHNDVKAMYMIALVTGHVNGFSYFKSGKSGYVESGSYADYQKSLYYWRKLQSMGYIGMDVHIDILEQKIEKEKNNFDILRSW